MILYMHITYHYIHLYVLSSLLQPCLILTYYREDCYLKERQGNKGDNTTKQNKTKQAIKCILNCIHILGN